MIDEVLFYPVVYIASKHTAKTSKLIDIGAILYKPGSFYEPRRRSAIDRLLFVEFEDNDIEQGDRFDNTSRIQISEKLFQRLLYRRVANIIWCQIKLDEDIADAFASQKFATFAKGLRHVPLGADKIIHEMAHKDALVDLIIGDRSDKEAGSQGFFDVLFVQTEDIFCHPENKVIRFVILAANDYRNIEPFLFFVAFKKEIGHIPIATVFDDILDRPFLFGEFIQGQ